MTWYVYINSKLASKGGTIYSEKITQWIHKKYLKKKGKILDAGCGNGSFSLAWKKLGYEVLACDIDPKEKSVKAVDLNKTWPYPKESFDYVFLWHVAEHLAEQDKWLNECRRVLKKGGKLIIGVPDWKSYHKHFFDVYTHRTPYTSDLIENIALIKGFKVIVNKRFSNLPMLWRFTPLAFEVKCPFKPRAIFAILEKNSS